MTDIPEDVKRMAREMCAVDGIDPDQPYEDKFMGRHPAWRDRVPYAEISIAAIMADREKRVSNPERMMKDALFALIKAGRETAQYGGVLCGDGKYAWMRFSVEPKAAPEPVDVDAVIEAATPFTEFADNNVDDDGWTGPMKTTRVADWFGPSDFRVLASAIRALKGEAK